MSYMILLKKEMVEGIRTYRLLIMGALFLLFGFLSPALAKLLPELIKSLGTGEAMIIEVPTPTVSDSWLQFFSNHTQMTLIILLITFSNSLSREIGNGTLIYLVTKGISRNAAMLAKITYQSLLWLVGLLVSFFVTYLYNLVLFPGEQQLLSTLLFYLCALWLFGVLFLFLSNLGQVLLPKGFGGLLVAFLGLVVFLIMGIFPKLAKFSPLRLVEVSGAAMKADVPLDPLQWPLVLATVLILLAAVGGIIRFKRIPIY